MANNAARPATATAASRSSAATGSLMAYYYHHRRSIFGGLILILIGILLLLHQFHPEIGIGPIFERYWPLLLVLWGVALLIDYLFTPRLGGTHAPVVAGSEVALIVVLLVVVAGLAGLDWAHRHNSDFNFDMGDMFNHPYSWKTDLPAVSAKPNAPISITTNRGDITINPTNDSQLHVSIDKTAHADSEDDARKSADNIQVKITPTGGGFDIEPETGGAHVEDSDVQTDLDIRLPAKSNITAQTTHGDIKLAGMSGPVTITSQSGDLDLHDVTGDVTATMNHGDTHMDAVKGNVRLDGHGGEVDLSNVSGDATIEGDFYGPIRARGVQKTTRYTSSRSNLTISGLSGQMEMDPGDLSVSDVNGSLTLTTANKDVTLDNIGGRIDLTDKRGEISLHFAQAPRDDVRIADDSGNIDITLPAHSNFTISAISRNGDIQNGFEASGLKSSTSGETTILNGTYGNQGPHITLSTSYGTISIHRAE
ncbi:MAG TPA: DUF4097 family beta strand repeat-containing protein [Candidatus Acidoferrales bacterium]|nr:DUF4097 family beta strand repeat-containing protein [Candidatus Acidoferrales bacterium]